MKYIESNNLDNERKQLTDALEYASLATGCQEEVEE